MAHSRYRHLAIKRAKPSPTDTHLAAIETLLDAHLPASFRDFLRVANGGYLEYVIDVPTGTGKTEPLCFCSLFLADEGTFCDGTLIGEIRSAREYLKIPQGVLPFARDGGGSIVYLDLSPKGNGRVVAFVTGLPEWAGSRTESAFIELASSFDEYVAKLRIDRDVVIDQLLDDPTDMLDVDAIEEWLDIGMPRWREDSELVTILCSARRSLTPRSGGG
jgi:SMI1 / KNR4 family (SUKH-1)